MVLYVVVLIFSVVLGSSGNELLWIIDIYLLVMVGMVLLMGVFGDKIGFKCLLLFGSVIFGIVLLCVVLLLMFMMLIVLCVLLVVGVVMIVLVMLVGICSIFVEVSQCNMVLGLWVVVGFGGVVFGLLVGGILLEYFYWGLVFLINVLIVLVVIVINVKVVLCQFVCCEQLFNLLQVFVLIVVILMLVFSVKLVLKGQLVLWFIVLVVFGGVVMLIWFICKQLLVVCLMVDMCLFIYCIILSGVMMVMMVLIILVGFELLMVQELQFVYQKMLFEVGIFMLLVMVVSGFSGLIVGLLVLWFGLCEVVIGGMLFSVFSFFGLVLIDFSIQQWLVWGLMMLLGFSVVSVLLVFSFVIMVVVLKEKVVVVGVIEIMVYELGVGFGIVLFGLILICSYSVFIVLLFGLSGVMVQQVVLLIGEVVSLFQVLFVGVVQVLMVVVKMVFIQVYSLVLVMVGVLFLLLVVGIWCSFVIVVKLQLVLQLQ